MSHTDRRNLHVLWINEKADFAGGCEQYIFDTVRLLSEKGVKSTLLYTIDEPTNTSFLKPFNYAFPLVDLHRQIKEITPDIIYLHQLTGIDYLKIVQKAPVPVVRFYHDHRLFCLREHKYKTLTKKTCTKPVGLRCIPCLGFVKKTRRFPKISVSCLPCLQKEIAENRKLDGFIVGSAYMKNHLCAHGFDGRKIMVNPLYSMFSLQDEKIDKDKELLFFAGSLVTGKGIDLLLKAMTKTKQKCHLVLAGSGKQEREYKELTPALGLEKRVEFLGKIPREELNKYYAKAALFIMPARTPETFSLVGVEATAFQTPVIASDVGGITEWLKDKENGLLFPSGDVSKLTEAIDELLSDDVRREKMGIVGQKMFEENYKPEIHIEHLMTFFDEILSGVEK